ncbi:unnamed protein product [Acidithrix sp. C25]|nr:unnamed protein product [Acidithrix sp. C25]
MYSRGGFGMVDFKNHHPIFLQPKYLVSYHLWIRVLSRDLNEGFELGR